ncbi:MAG: CcoQ/FixQ family Cbb3-type cytochrome c oxidase assembly chaperone [Methylocystis sp.]|nr:MAG: CcoQ/FixQ family Cbb3-type cytochrome c oxidase assembly chaperone [Methylocystis sp.]
MNTGSVEAVTTYEGLRAFAGAWGLIFFGFIFLGVVAYAFWPSRRKEFEQDAQIPLREDDDDV